MIEVVASLMVGNTGPATISADFFSTLHIINTTVAHNGAPSSGGGVVVSGDLDSVFGNLVIWGNQGLRQHRVEARVRQHKAA